MSTQTALLARRAIDCLAGMPCADRGRPNRELMGWHSLVATHKRVSVTAPDGTGILLGDSFTNYIAPNYIGADFVNLGISGSTIRHLLQQLLRAPSLIHRAGCVIIYGTIGNSIEDEMEVGVSEETMFRSIDYMIEGLSNWLTGRGIFIAQPLVMEPYYPNQQLTNARIERCNGFIAKHFGNKPGWSVVDVNHILAPEGQLLAEYSEMNPDGTPQRCHLNRAGIDVVFEPVRAQIRRYQAELVPA